MSRRPTRKAPSSRPATANASIRSSPSASFASPRTPAISRPSSSRSSSPVIQEEARHILFFINWLRYLQRRRLRSRCASGVVVAPLLAVATKAWNRLSLARATEWQESMPI
jgi:hypothetical protein